METVPFLDSDDYGLRFAVAGDDGSLSSGCGLDEGRKHGLGFAKLHLSHGNPQSGYCSLLHSTGLTGLSVCTKVGAGWARRSAHGESGWLGR